MRNIIGKTGLTAGLPIGKTEDADMIDWTNLLIGGIVLVLLVGFSCLTVFSRSERNDRDP